MTRCARAVGLAAVLYAICLTPAVAAPTGWCKTYGGSNLDAGYSVQPTSDGGYIVAGETGSFGGENGAVYLIKTDGGGDTVWTRTWDGRWGDEGYSVQQTADGGYVIAGTTEWYPRAGGGGATDIYLIKTNAQGDELWTQSYGGYYWEWGRCVVQTADGGYIIVGETSSYGAGAPNTRDVYLIKTDAQGDTLWTKTFGGPYEDAGYSVQQTADGGYIVTGGTAADRMGVYLIKTNAQGDTLWTRTYLGNVGCSVRQTADSGYILSGFVGLQGPGSPDTNTINLIKTNALGDTLWTRAYGGAAEGGHSSVRQTADGGYIVTGHTKSFGAGWSDVYLVKINAQGDTLWTRTYGGTDNDVGYSVEQTAEGGYIIAGATRSFGAGGFDVYLIKTDSLGKTGVAEEGQTSQPALREHAATVVRSLPQGQATFDAMGRRALHPKPGVYFVREEPQASSPKPQAVRKVLLVR
jgi:hypothetical protein